MTTFRTMRHWRSNIWPEAIKTVHQNLLAIGLVATSDTGQIDLTGADPTFINNTNASYGYRVYRFNDAAQATCPIFFKLAWASSVYTASIPALNVTIGSGTDGAGAITGNWMNTASIGVIRNGNAIGGADAALQLPLYVAGDASGFSMVCGFDDPNALTYNNNGGQLYFSIDRFRDEAGAARDTGFVIGCADQFKVIAPGKTGSPLPLAYMPGYAPWVLGGTASEAFNSVVPISPCMMLAPGPEYSVMMVSVPAADFAVYAEFDVEHLGATRRYLSLSNSNGFISVTGAFTHSPNRQCVAVLVD